MRWPQSCQEHCCPSIEFWASTTSETNPSWCVSIRLNSNPAVPNWPNCGKHRFQGALFCLSSDQAVLDCSNWTTSSSQCVSADWIGYTTRSSWWVHAMFFHRSKSNDCCASWACANTWAVRRPRAQWRTVCCYLCIGFSGWSIPERLFLQSNSACMIAGLTLVSNEYQDLIQWFQCWQAAFLIKLF